MRAGIYARISSDREGDGLGVNRQLEDCEQLAEQRGWAVAETYVDDDVSAYSGKARPEYARMLDDLRTGSINGVLVYHLDRLHRQPKELEEFFEVCEAAGVRDLASFTGDSASRISATFRSAAGFSIFAGSCWSRQERSAHARACALRSSASPGKPVGGRPLPPFLLGRAPQIARRCAHPFACLLDQVVH